MDRHRYRPLAICHAGFASVFDGNTGVYIRSDVFGTQGSEPFQAEFPELIDVGIMERCVCSSRCNVDCYQKACARTGPNMALEDYAHLLEQCKGRVFQVALGGAGDPDSHESFRQILECSAEANIVPNFTTSGIAMTAEKAGLCRAYCGAVAVSEHFSDYTTRAVRLLLDAGVKTNIHYVLSAETIDFAIGMLRTGCYPNREGINAVVFLLYKPVGLGRPEKVLRLEDPRVREFFGLVGGFHGSFKIGFDSCSCSALVNCAQNVAFDMVDYCEGGRFSMYVSADLTAFPCSFANQNPELGFRLAGARGGEGGTLQQAWDSFTPFREQLKTRCPDCRERALCGGGCPLLSSIVLCSRGERTVTPGFCEQGGCKEETE